MIFKNSLPKIKDFFSDKNFIFLWLEQAFTQIAYHLVNFSLIISVFKLTNSNFSVGILLICFYLPSALFVTIAGLTSDFINRKKIIIATNIIWATLVLILSFFTNQFAAICLIAILIQITDEFFVNAVTASIPNIVTKEKLLSANSLFNLTFYASMVVASLLVSLMNRLLFSNSPLFLASFLTFLGAFFISKIKFQQKIQKVPLKNFSFQLIFQEISKGWQTITSSPVIKSLTFFLVVSNSLLSLVYAITPGLLSDFGIEASDFSMVLIIPLGLGLVLGNLYLHKNKEKKRKINFIRQGLIIMGALILIIALIPKSTRLHSITQKKMNFEKRLGISLPLSLVFCGLGFSAILTFIPAATSFQENLPEEVRGRTTSINQLLIYILSTILSFSSGAISDLLGFFPLLAALSSLCIFAGIFSKKILIKTGALIN